MDLKVQAIRITKLTNHFICHILGIFCNVLKQLLREAPALYMSYAYLLLERS